MVASSREQLLQQLEDEGVIDPRAQADPSWAQIWDAMEPEHLQALLDAKRAFDQIAHQQDFSQKSFWGIIK
jgi:hypothetical protein